MASQPNRTVARDSSAAVAGPTPPAITGESPPIRALRDTIRMVAPTDAVVLIEGESGTGKELVARTLHQQSLRQGRFVAINMAAIPGSLIESTLFGHERGAFTGATSRRIGACEEADGGTLFLDEICEMPLEFQAKLLRVLQESIFRRVGGNQDIPSKARIVAATNRDTLNEVRRGRMREDLYYRLNVVPIHTPSLRERQEDIPNLVQEALIRFSKQHGRSLVEVSPAAESVLTRCPWPGNIRELLHVLERVVILSTNRCLTPEMLPSEILEGTLRLEQEPDPEPSQSTQPATPQTLADTERNAIRAALMASDGDVNRAAARLAISPATIYRKVRRYGIDLDQIRT